MGGTDSQRLYNSRLDDGCGTLEKGSYVYGWIIWSTVTADPGNKVIRTEVLSEGNGSVCYGIWLW